ncbi:uncharacterized protein LOC108701566 [Xenopus laevis]|uniref:G-protein coupled receptors family 1 profile domain-containing protein n=2 Tax=Xenopus laevis TaxID=8355 RepID=A0A974C0H6_XENLA|nr:uncharacterized protein LOC108701566 [Xenopus laevis]OCT64166.1 hypothetical protein XELAEV_18045267mg [Xenopus laevis]
MALQNQTELYYPSQTLSPDIDIEEVIYSQNVISRVLHGYIGIMVPLGLLSGIAILAIIIRKQIRHQIMENVDFYLLSVAVTDLTIILYSFTAITRPSYMEITNLACGAVSSLFNMSYFTTQNLLLLMFLTMIAPNTSTLSSLMTMVNQNRLATLSVTVIFSILLSLLATSLLGTHKSLQATTFCQLDPLNAKPEYDLVKFTAGFCLPTLFMLLFFLLLVYQLRQAEDSTVKETIQAQKVTILHVAILFVCRLFYNIMLIRRASLKLCVLSMSPREELLFNIAELMVFSGSSLNLIFTLTLHGPCRLGVWKALRFLKKLCCKSQTYDGVEMHSSAK